MLLRDDLYIIAGNDLLGGWSNLPRLLATGYWEGPMSLDAPARVYRPLMLFSYFLTNQFFGLRPWLFHLTNVLLYAADCALLFVLLRRHYAARLAFAAAALFAVMPVHSEVVAYISERSQPCPDGHEPSLRPR